MEPFDVVYTWVDDAWPGYAAELSAHARDGHDGNPNRTRDNLELLRYSLRALERFAPWARRVHLVTMRPQVPRWLAPGAVEIVHHDALFDPAHLPSFNSFAIVSHLADLPGVSERFLYLEDDRLFLRSVAPGDFVTPDGRLRLWSDGRPTPGAARRFAKDAPRWDLALAWSNHELDQRYGQAPRACVKRAPLFVDRASLRRCLDVFAAAIARTRASRFRSPGDVATEHLYPHFLWHEGLAEWVPRDQVRREVGYVGLEGVALWNALLLARLARKSPKLACLNDNFGARPSRRAEDVARRFLARTFPEPSRFEREGARSAA